MNKQKFISGDVVRLKTKKYSGEIYEVITVGWDGFSNRNIYYIKNLNPPYNLLSKYSYELEIVAELDKVTIIMPEKDNSTITLEFDKTTLNTIDSANKFKNCANKIIADGVVVKNRYGEVDENTRAFKLTLEEAQEMYNAGGKLREFALRVFTEDELKPKPKYPTTWDDYCDNFYPFEKHMHYYPQFAHGFDTDDADAFIAYGRLIRLRKAWVGDWKPDWDNKEMLKWCIGYWKNKVVVFDYYGVARSLSFPTKEMAENFMNCFEDLLEKAKTLI